MNSNNMCGVRVSNQDPDDTGEWTVYVNELVNGQNQIDQKVYYKDFIKKYFQIFVLDSDSVHIQPDYLETGDEEERGGRRNQSYLQLQLEHQEGRMGGRNWFL